MCAFQAYVPNLSLQILNGLPGQKYLKNNYSYLYVQAVENIQVPDCRFEFHMVELL